MVSKNGKSQGEWPPWKMTYILFKTPNVRINRPQTLNCNLFTIIFFINNLRSTFHCSRCFFLSSFLIFAILRNTSDCDIKKVTKQWDRWLNFAYKMPEKWKYRLKDPKLQKLLKKERSRRNKHCYFAAIKSEMCKRELFYVPKLFLFAL